MLSFLGYLLIFFSLVSLLPFILLLFPFFSRLWILAAQCLYPISRWAGLDSFIFRASIVRPSDVASRAALGLVDSYSDTLANPFLPSNRRSLHQLAIFWALFMERLSLFLSCHNTFFFLI